MIEFSRLSDFTKTVQSILIGMMAEIEDFETIKNAFDELDHNHDGMLTLKDFKIAKEKNIIDGKLEDVVS